MGTIMHPRPLLHLVPEKRLVMTFALKQALEILQMPQQELAQWLAAEIDKNPLLEFDQTPTSGRYEAEVPSPLKLYDHLLHQIREHFPKEPERKIAETFLEQLDERGLICCPHDPIAPAAARIADQVLKVLQTFDPPGIFARTLQEALLIQLRAKGKETGPGSLLLREYYDDLLRRRYAFIRKKIGADPFNQAINELSSLAWRPARSFQEEPAVWVYPDLQFEKTDETWAVQLIEDELPSFHLKTEYFDLQLESNEEKEVLREFKTRAKWICRSLDRRRNLLRKIGAGLLTKQISYLEGRGPLIALTMKELSAELQIHESTLSRALSGKYASIPGGIVPLKSLISSDPAGEEAKQILRALIQQEDKNRPCTDDQLAQELEHKGFKLARRTITKYRNELKIGSAAQRKRTEV